MDVSMVSKYLMNVRGQFAKLQYKAQTLWVYDTNLLSGLRLTKDQQGQAIACGALGLAPDCSQLISSPNIQSGIHNEMDPVLICTAVSDQGNEQTCCTIGQSDVTNDYFHQYSWLRD